MIRQRTAVRSSKAGRASAGESPSSEVVLFAVSGMSPAVLTETVWALAQEKPALIPDRVVVVTTVLGRQKIRDELLTGEWEKLQRAVNADERLEFGDTGHHLRVITRGTVELDDIRTPADNAAAADFILEQLRSLVENPDIRVVATIAGGRKTMSALLYGCMSLIGREADRITHVLVDGRLEQRRDPKFFFPTNKEEARGVCLADIPFVPLRNRFRDLDEMPGSFNRLTASYSRLLKSDSEQPVLVKLLENGVEVNGLRVRLRDRALHTLRYLIHVNRERKIPIGQPEAVEPMKAFLGPAASAWITDADDIKRELNFLRDKLGRSGVRWGPGLRRDSLRLPLFKLIR